jgi:hypothetical protein
VERRADPNDLGIPEAAMRAAERRAETRLAEKRAAGVPVETEQTPLKMADEEGRLVCLYAAQSTESTPELSLPRDAAERRRHGLFTYTLCQVLSEATRPLTYKELIHRVRAQYARMNRSEPIPLVEGKDIDRYVLGDKVEPGRSKFVLGERDNAWIILAGRLHGLTRGTILAVYPNDGEEPIGHVRITKVRLMDCDVEPSEFGGKAANANLSRRLRCEPVQIDYGDMRLKVAAEAPGRAAAPAHDATWREVNAALDKLRKEKGSLIEVVADPVVADWIIRAEEDGVFLMPSHGVQVRRGGDSGSRFRLQADPEFSAEFREKLARIARAQNLISLPAHERVRGDQDVKIELELVQYQNKEDKVGVVVDTARGGLTFTDGDYIGFRMHNRSKSAKVYPTLLFIDSEYKIDSRYPPKGEFPGPLIPGKAVETGPLDIKTNTVGKEQVVIIAVKDQGVPVYFMDLEQPSVEQATRGGRDSPFETPLGRLLQNAAYARGTTRSLNTTEIADYATDGIAWTVVKPSR